MTNIINATVDSNQPREHAGFSSEYSTTDHTHVMNQIVEESAEYNISPCKAFIDYETPFDSVKIKGTQHR